jgi:hypothetical protein
MEQPITNRRDYMRDYQRQRYNADLEKARAYQQSLKLKKRLNLNDELWEKYKHHLADIVKLTKIMEHLPTELIMEVLQNPPQIVVQEAVV